MIDGKPLVFGIGLLLSGCATLQVAPLDTSGKNNVGVGYVLPFTQYAVTTSWRLDYCPKANTRKPRDVPRIAVKIDAVSGSADDGDLAYILDPQKLQTLTSVTSFTAKWHDGRNLLSSVGASAEDRSAQVVGNLVKSAIKIVPLLAGKPAPGAKAPLIDTPPLCTEEGTVALYKAKAAKRNLDASTAALKAVVGAVEAAAAKIATMGAAVSEDAKTEYGKALTALDEASAAQDDAVTALTQALKPITFVRKIRWPATGNEFSHGPQTVDAKAIENWLNQPAREQVEQQRVYLQIERTGSFGRKPEYRNLSDAAPNAIATAGDPPKPAPKAVMVKGLPYRLPAAGRLVACSVSPCMSENVADVLASLDGPVVQLGYVNILPFRSRAFGNNSFNAEFALDGSLKSVGYEQKAAPLEGATGALLDAATQVAGAVDPLAKLTAKNAYLKQLKEEQTNLEALKPAVVDPGAVAISALDAETALIDAQLAKINARIALAEAGKKL